MANKPTNTSAEASALAPCATKGWILILLLLCSANIAYAVTYELQGSNFDFPKTVWATCWIDKENTVAPQGYGEATESYSSLQEYENRFTIGRECKVITLGPGTWHRFSQQEVDAPSSVDVLVCGKSLGFVAACPDDHVLWLRSDQRISARVASGAQVEAYTIGQASGCSFVGDTWLTCTLSADGVSVAVGLAESIESCNGLTIDEPFVCRQGNAATASPSAPAGSPSPPAPAGSPSPPSSSAAGTKMQVCGYLANIAGSFLILRSISRT